MLASYQVSTDADRADANGVIRLTVDQPYENHNGGQLCSVPTAISTWGSATAAVGAIPMVTDRTATIFSGSILRLDVSGATGYAVPAGNPLVGVAGNREELWDWGLRNPWRFSFDRSTGDLYIGDVGQGSREEIDVSTATSGSGKGVNYGWSIMEGMAMLRCRQLRHDRARAAGAGLFAQ